MKNIAKRVCFWQWMGFLLTIFLPGLSWADSTPINFTPQPSDVSMTFLTNIFGIVDGVLYGGGSQIMGSMFSIFNAAVLSLGGMVLIYTTMVATINTAGEGQVLGKNWSSIWIPVRSTLGLSLLFTYSSGYSVLQIFVMWLIVQGVGAGDLIWNAALGYLNRGGVIIQQTSMSYQTNSNNNYSVMKGARVVLAGTSCMAALQQQLETMYNNYTAQANQGTGPCINAATGQPWTSVDGPQMYAFCNGGVPSLSNTVDIMGAQQAVMDAYNKCYSTCMSQADATSSKCSQAYDATKNPYGCGPTAQIAVPMPNFSTENTGSQDYYYAGLNGICGTIKWNPLDMSKVSSSASTLGLSQSEATDMANTRGIAVEQMYLDLSAVAQLIIQNDLTLQGSTGCTTGASCYMTRNGNSTYTAASPLGIPAAASGSTSCKGALNSSSGTEDCDNWISPKTGFSPVLGGVEYQGSVNDYNSIMLPTLNALNNTNSIAQSTKFTETAQKNGWIMAGTYFYDLVKANSSNANSSMVDTTSGLDSSVVPPHVAENTGTFCSGGTNSILCTWYGTANQTEYNNEIVQLMRGPTPNVTTTASLPTYDGTPPTVPFYDNELNATVYGYISNGSNVLAAGQQGASPPNFTYSFNPPSFKSVKVDYSCGSGFMKIPRDVCNALWKVAFSALDKFFKTAEYLYETAIYILIGTPLSMLADLFKKAINIIADNTLNPIVALALVGDMFIDFCANTWLGIAIALGMMSVYVIPAFPITVLCMVAGPLVLSWLGMLWGMGVMMVFYLPLLPYVIFTFSAFGWMIGVLEAMVAAPLVALGVSLPEGKHEVFGHGIDSLMLILGAFLRPSLIIIGYVSAIILSTVGIWLINTGFGYFTSGLMDQAILNNEYSLWPSLFAEFFMFGSYLLMCWEIIQRAFDLIFKLPDGILKWIGGGMQEAFGAGVVGQVSQAMQGQSKEGGQALQAGLSAKRDMTKGKNKTNSETDIKDTSTDSNSLHVGGG